MKATGYFKTVKGERFYIKAIRGGYFGVYNKLDMSLESLCLTKVEAEELARELNNLRK
ncbi:hypothetical protein [Elizabethkingia miricola]|uniref:Uncharacterized protein n=1 Tax=Elizabethkingia miricola TaxID=172045 RepID=A0ABD5B3Q0_ELIMR|nr:hypothetical protein [Elizabethkingia miricola]MDQ8748390.1 hypothetical protein [Elizabethkingia miricola]